jgi:hypothetical protein
LKKHQESKMETTLRSITLSGRTIQGFTPIFIEYALWIAIMGLLIFMIGELLVRAFRLKDRRVEWIAAAFNVHPQNVAPIPCAHLLGLETKDATSRQKNPFSIPAHPSNAHQGDYVVRGAQGTALVSVYNWRNARAQSTKNEGHSGFVALPVTRKSNFYTGFLKETQIFSPDEHVKAKAATLNVSLLTQFASQARICAVCLHKNRPFSLITRTTKRDLHGRLAAHIDIEQITNSYLPTGDGGYVDDETWRDLRQQLLSQISRMNSPYTTFARIIMAFGLLGFFYQFRGSTITPDNFHDLIKIIAQLFKLNPP